MMKRIFLILGLIGLSSIWANTALDIGEFPSSATETRKAGIEGFSPQASVIFENPASLANLKVESISLFSSQIMGGESTLNSFSIHYPLKIGNVAIGYMKHGVNGLIKTTTLLEFAGGERYPLEEGTFLYQDTVWKYGYGRALTKKMNIGLNISRFVYSMDTVEGVGINMDVGVYQKFKKIESSLIVKNCLKNGITYKNSTDSPYGNGTYQLPRRIQASIKYDQIRDYMGQRKYTIFGQIYVNYLNRHYSKSTFTTPALAVSIEIPISKNPTVQVSAGYSIIELYTQRVNRLNIGFGYDLGFIDCDFAYEKSDYLPNRHQFYFSISIKDMTEIKNIVSNRPKWEIF